MLSGAANANATATAADVVVAAAARGGAYLQRWPSTKIRNRRSGQRETREVKQHMRTSRKVLLNSETKKLEKKNAVFSPEAKPPENLNPKKGSKKKAILFKQDPHPTPPHPRT